MLQIDERLLDVKGEIEITENLNRIMALIDALESQIDALAPTENGGT